MLGVDFSALKTLLIEWSFNNCLIEFCNFGRLKIRRTKFLECEIRDTDFVSADITEADFSGSDLQGSKFQNTILEKADLSSARNYFIDPLQNRIKRAKFSYPEVLGLLASFGIVIE